MIWAPSRAAAAAFSMSIAFFDLDGTLIDADSNLLFFDHLLEHGYIGPDFLAPLAAFSEQYFSARLRIEDFIVYAVGPVAGMARAERERLVMECTEQRLLPALKPGARRTLEHHRARGDLTVIVSATADYLVLPAARRLGITHALASPLRYDAAGVLLPEVCGICPYQEGKARRILQFVQERQLTLEGSHAYGDSLNDVQMLRLCEHGFAVDASRSFREAECYGEFTPLNWRT